ncbi:Meiotic nuclear division protein 1-like protein [Psilocybe cubensis]|uniref:Meiotic nuclear division protein 1-like protein n=1 Tax=Psilocybe cubensis TaxID=181762 RepID=A0ACB8HE01_PSICU|nr:Meiotic nuclear division protein 1-like protein [Psilocybe cubensis]KAH9485404.1 Meiotic nuclear division protein 1-like protein [Psilocybe cubensis]
MEEKRIKLLEIFHETRDFYQLKELEKLGPKLKGIGVEHIQLEQLQAKLDAAKETQSSHQSQIIELNSAIHLAKSERAESDVRTTALKNLSELKKELSTLESELNAYGDSNPAKVDEVKRAAFLAKEATYRWTDNYGILLGHFTRQTGVGVDDLRQYLGINEDYEDLE